MTNAEDDPRMAGSLAWCEGIGSDENPFRKGTGEYDKWRAGWFYMDRQFDDCINE